MNETEVIYIALGLAVSLLFAELLGVAPGGIIVPGYLALSMHEPLRVVVTLAIGFLTFFVVRVFATMMIVYGRRRTVMMILVGFLLGSLVRLGFNVGGPIGGIEIDLVGYIIPGLIAIWIDRQGAVVTLTTATTAAIVTRVGAILLMGV